MEGFVNVPYRTIYWQKVLIDYRRDSLIDEDE